MMYSYGILVKFTSRAIFFPFYLSSYFPFYTGWSYSAFTAGPISYFIWLSYSLAVSFLIYTFVMRWNASNLLWLVLVAILTWSVVDGAPTQHKKSSRSKAISAPSGPKAVSPPKAELKTLTATTPEWPVEKVKPVSQAGQPKSYADAVKHGQSTGQQQHQATVPQSPSRPQDKPTPVEADHNPSTEASDKPKKTYAEVAKEGLAKSQAETPSKSGAGDASQTKKKPRCPSPRSKGKIGKRAMDCEEWDDNDVKPLKNTNDVTSERNPHMIGYSGKYTYTEGLNGKQPLTDKKLRDMNLA